MALPSTEESPCIAIRFEEDLNLPADLDSIIDKREIAAFYDRSLNVKVTDFKLNSIQMSTVIGLSDLFEEEVIMPPIPMYIDLENVKINVVEDRPPVNITSPGPQPINLCIGKMKLQRDSAGTFQIQPLEQKNTDEENLEQDITPSQIREREREILSMQLIMKQLKVDNENLRRQLMISEKNVEVGRQKIKQENEILKTYLKAAQDDVATLLDEKRTLMDTIKSLQVIFDLKNRSKWGL
jgi:hypothetical protein